GAEAGEIAAVLTERGLGGDSVDLDVRLDQFRRDRSQRASSARSLAQRWASQVAASEGLPSPSPLAGGGGGGVGGVRGSNRGANNRRHARLRLSRPRRAQPRQWRLRARQWTRRR